MDRSRGLLPLWLCAVVTTVLVLGCAPSGPSRPADDASAAQQPSRKKVLNLGLRAILDGFSISGSASLAGGALGYIEIHSQALFSSDKTTGRPIPRLLAEHPTLDNDGLRVTDDGRMLATYKLRRDVQWADGAPFTTRDLMFTFNLTRDRSVPILDPAPSELMDSATAPDDYTFVLTWKQPYYLADAVGLQGFWPLPAHLLETDYNHLVVDQKDVQTFMAKPYWTSEYVHVGPFKLVEWVPGVEATFDAVEHYFLGRPRVDRIVVKQYEDPNTLYANILSGTVDLSTDLALQIQQGTELKERWERTDGGSVWYANGPTWFVSYQFERSTPGLVPFGLDRRVRQALYHAVDRDEASEAVQAGVTGRGGHSLLASDHPLHSFVKDGWKQRYPYDPARASALLEEAGWRRGADGVLVNTAGERFRAPAWTTMGNERNLTVVADMWRRLGADVEEFIIPAARVRDREFRQAFPWVEVTARGNDDTLLTRLDCPASPNAQNRYSGNNRGHWCSAEFDRLATQYRSTLREAERGPLIRQLQDVMLDEVPITLLHYSVSVVLARKGVNVFHDDFAGGGDSGRGWGTYSRNAHEWDYR
jgi:peptide/nickel transport system substrate-binding protein